MKVAMMPRLGVSVALLTTAAAESNGLSPSKRERLIGAKFRCEAMSFTSPLELVLYVTGEGPAVLRWPDAALQSALKIENAGLGPLACSVSGLIAAGGPEQKSILLWNPSGKTVRTQIQSRGPAFDCVAFCPKGDLLATGDHDGNAFIFRASDGTLTHELNAHLGTVWALAWSPDGHKLATASADNDICIWDAGSGRLDSRVELTFSSFAIAWSPDSQHLYFGGASGTLTRWDADKKALAGESSRGTGLIQVLAISHDGSRIAAGGLNAEGWQRPASVSVFDATTLSRTAEFTAHAGAVTGISFTPDGKSIISASDVEPGLKIWEID